MADDNWSLNNAPVRIVLDMNDSSYPYRWPKRTTGKTGAAPGGMPDPKTRSLDDELMAAANRSAELILSSPHIARSAGFEGTCIHGVNGEEVVTDAEGIAFVPNQDMLLVADLHLEKGSSIARRGQLLPPYDTLTTLRRLTACVEKWQPAKVVALGDSFHDDTAWQRLTPQARDQITGLMDGREWIWITGNHDPLPPIGLGGQVLDCLDLGPFTLRHEPMPGFGVCEIAGHLHPKARLVRRGRHVRRSCFAASRTRMILPSFGAYTGGLNVLDVAYHGLFDGRSFHALMRGDRQVYRIAGKDLS